MNLFDLAAILIFVAAIILGFRSGAIPQVGGLAGAVAGGVAGVLLVPVAMGLVPELDPASRAIAVLVLVLVSVGAGEAVGSAIGRRLGARLGDGFAAAVDDVVGGLVGFAQGVLVVWLTGGILAAGAIPSLTPVAQTSTALRTISGVLPSPTELATGLGRALDVSGLPDVFIGLEPIPAPPIDVPDNPAAVAIAGSAVRSTVKVSAATCGAQSSGSGFAVSAEYVVTNAHVIAGATVVRVALGGQLHDAVPVLFDSDLDLAVLYAPRLAATPLRFATIDPPRGTTAAAIGFPGGGRLNVNPVAVTAAYEAQGLDLTGTHRVLRRILELRATIERGDSGGPVVLRDGTVGGVVFAESRADPEVGYALAASAVATRVAPAIGRTGPVATGACIN